MGCCQGGTGCCKVQRSELTASKWALRDEVCAMHQRVTVWTKLTINCECTAERGHRKTAAIHKAPETSSHMALVSGNSSLSGRAYKHAINSCPP